MKTTSSKIVKITQKPSATSLSKAQKLFNKLIKKIDMQRQQLRAWQTSAPLYHQKHASEYVPLLKTYNQHRTQLVYLFDRVYHDKIFNVTDQKKLSDLITNIAGELLADKDAPQQLKVIFNEYHETDFDTQGEEVKADLKAMMEEMFGMEIDGEIDPNDPEAILRLMTDKAQEMHERAATAQQEGSKRKKSAKTLAKEARLAEKEKNISQSIREVYRKLASALHPDREQDAAEHARKTNLMKRVNVAYGNKDLLQLLELQLEVEQIDQAMINTIGEDRLKHYNQILTEQAGELALEIEQNDLAFRLRFQIDPDAILAPNFLIPKLEHDIAQLQQDIIGIAQDLQDFEQLKMIKAWLKTYRPSPLSMHGGDAFDDLDLSALFNKR